MTDHAALGLSRPQALNRYLSNERSIQRKGTYTAFQEVVKVYLDLGHAEPVPSKYLTSSKTHYYLPMHGVTKLRGEWSIFFCWHVKNFFLLHCVPLYVCRLCINYQDLRTNLLQMAALRILLLTFISHFVIDFLSI